MHLEISSCADICFGKVCSFPGAQTCLPYGQQACMCCWIVQEQPGWLSQCFAEVWGLVHKMHWLAELSSFPQCKPYLASQKIAEVLQPIHLSC